MSTIGLPSQTRRVECPVRATWNDRAVLIKRRKPRCAKHSPIESRLAPAEFRRISEELTQFGMFKLGKLDSHRPTEHPHPRCRISHGLQGPLILWNANLARTLRGPRRQRGYRQLGQCLFSMLLVIETLMPYGSLGGGPKN